MYDLIDRPVGQQAPPLRLLVWSMRHWVKGALQGRCVCHVIDGAFGSAKVRCAEEHFHRAMRIVCNDAKVPLHFGEPTKQRITEHEAMILAAIQAAADGRSGRVRSLARSVVHADMEPAFANALCLLADEFEQAGHSLATS